MSSSPVTILVVGKDARTDAIIAAVKRSRPDARVHALAEMRIPGFVEKCATVECDSLLDVDFARAQALKVDPDLAIIGPEEPLEKGFTDALQALGIPVFGPSRQLAAIEYSKSWARRLLDRHGIDGNPRYRVFETLSGLESYLEEGPFVVKPDGLTAGKGVKVYGEHLHSIGEALDYCQEILASHGKVQIEERLEGEEFSLQTITDGETWIHCPPVQDHKRAYTGDTGPNTGGMGSYSCADHSLPFLTQQDLADAQAINEQVIEALRLECGSPYRGVLYGGFIATRDGVRLIEYNSRFGDPEAMNVLPLLEADFVEVCLAAATGNLAKVPYSWANKATVCKYVVPERYPQKTPERVCLPVAPGRDRDDLQWYWAACAQEHSGIFLTGSRAGAFVGIGDTLAEAEAKAEAAATELEQRNGGVIRHRADIGGEALVQARIDHMRSLRAGVLAAS